MYFRQAHVVVLVYDIADRSSFDNVTMWMQEVARYNDTP
jgi:GTPase SAR1 family protein